MNDHNADECKRFAGSEKLNAEPYFIDGKIKGYTIDPDEYLRLTRNYQSAAQPAPVVPEGLSIAMQQRDHYADRVLMLELGIGRIADDFMPDSEQQAALALDEMRQALRDLLAAAPAQGQQVECQECDRLTRQVKNWQDLAVANRKVADDALSELDSIRRMAECGTVQNWLKLPEEDKAKWFALMVGADSENKRLRAEVEALKSQQVGQEPVAWRMWNGKTWRFCYSDLHGKRGWEALYTAPQPAPAQDVAGWIPVTERLPNCGQAVLAYYLNRQGIRRRIRAEYVTRWTVEAEMFADPDTECVEYSELEDAYYVTEGWYELIDNWDEYARIAVNEGVVTRWMPLPAAPTARDKQSHAGAARVRVSTSEESAPAGRRR